MDSWEDADEDEFKPPVVPAAATGTLDNWEDEEDQTLIEQQAAIAAMAIRAAPTPQQIEAQKKREELEEQRLQNHVKYAQQENETAEQRTIRERKQVEDADAALAEELFDAPSGPKRSVSSSSGLAGLNLRNKEDHVNFGIMASKKMAGSTSFCIAAFLKEVLKGNGSVLSAESLADISNEIQKLQASKKQAEDLTKKNQKSKKEQKAAAKKHAEIFGGDYDKTQEYDDYANLEDDFM